MIEVVFNATDVLPGMYHATATFFSNDPDLDEVPVDLTLEVSEIMVSASASNDNICSGQATQVIATPHGMTSDLTYMWTSDPEGFESEEQSPAVEPLESTWYYVTMTSSDRATASDSVFVNVRPLPVVDLGADTAICGNDLKMLDAGEDGIAYLWSTGETTRTITIDSTTLFDGYGEREITVTVYSNNKCEKSDTVIVDFVNCTGIDEFINNISASIYPNPNHGEFRLELNAIDEDVVDIYVVNQLGAVVYNNENVEISGQASIMINLEENASGLYQLFVRGKNSLINKKVIAK
jgi:hypothetical protein